ncbi:hypothetical protein PHSY_000804 [Pseudozyma hubeiensis SY62]|uniref:Zn(2)-C6 fungal-type domain-containing protein n=1 Tax=Pseudozyma hubeiensis (strain SY62) TaxID=1305764 RepID=R9P556_PSEHS|nr:hypothetical protein PHSY_000804 [Pseudozyma hubeiensis SY62]GAC93240.1 hypothetical protein PHSY_000804 [Pseudozyma hubeiensis SY62]
MAHGSRLIMSTAVYEQKRLACYPCRDKKLRCTTIQGDVCDRCKLRSLSCRRPLTKRRSEGTEPVAAARHSSNEPFPSRQSPSNSTRVAGHKRLRSTGNGRSAIDSSNETSSTKVSELIPTASTSRTVDFSGSFDSRPPYQRSHDVSLPLESAERLFWSILDRQRMSKGSFHFANHLDSSTALDPIRCHILTTREALHLVDRFMATFGKTLAYFDPRLCTFDFLQSRSQSLLSIICLTMARVEPCFGQIASRLEQHVHGTVYPAILSGGFRSVEVVQALLMLAAFEPPTEDVREDKSWSLLSHAARVASEINLQACMIEKTDTDHASEADQLQQRHAQRTWINLWLHEFSLAQHTGRQSILAEQDLFSSCRDWHHHPLAHYTDIALVSMVELRTIIKKNRSLFRLLSPGNEMIFAEQCKTQIEAWSRSWFNERSSIDSIPRLELSQLYVNHAFVQLLGLALHHQPQSEWPSSIVLDLYEACGTYLDVFPQRLPSHRLLYCYNSMWVAASYQVIVAVRLAQLGSSFAFIDGDMLLQKCQRVHACIASAAKVSAPGTAAHCYERFLDGVLRTSSSVSTGDAMERTSSTEASSSDSIAETLVQVSQGLHTIADPSVPSSEHLTEPTFGSLLGFDDLEFFAWAGASLAQNDDFNA